ncbi:MAG: YkgJ family cysteine cluster protein [Deltaproteobacteria bacterium]|nr:YkgJ family cysteine cluster protein [Deltaproteobacteria bacterium]
MSALDRYRELVAKVDVFFGRVEQRHGDQLLCGSGCFDCCLVRLSVTPVEAIVIADALAPLPATTRAHLAERARRDDPERCAALGDDGRCAIYAGRPLVCRSHGVPIRQRDARAEVVIDTCFRNFAERGAGAADPDCVLDQTTLSLTLLAIDSAHAAETGGAAGRRIAIADLLR